MISHNSFSRGIEILSIQFGAFHPKPAEMEVSDHEKEEDRKMKSWHGLLNETMDDKLFLTACKHVLKDFQPGYGNRWPTISDLEKAVGVDEFSFCRAIVSEFEGWVNFWGNISDNFYFGDPALHLTIKQIGGMSKILSKDFWKYQKREFIEMYVVNRRVDPNSISEKMVYGNSHSRVQKKNFHRKVCENMGIGYTGRFSLPKNIPEEVKRIQGITQGKQKEKVESSFKSIGGLV